MLGTAIAPNRCWRAKSRPRAQRRTQRRGAALAGLETQSVEDGQNEYFAIADVARCDRSLRCVRGCRLGRAAFDHEVEGRIGRLGLVGSSCSLLCWWIDDPVDRADDPRYAAGAAGREIDRKTRLNSR